MNVQELHDLVAVMHQTYCDQGGPGTQIGMMIALVVGGRVILAQVEAEDRATWYARASALVRLSGASAYCAVSEAWMASAPRAGDPLAALSPSQREDKAEVVATVCVGRDGSRASSIKVIERDPATGRVAALIDRGGLDMSDGDLFYLFG
jgi:hypothetical protein